MADYEDDQQEPKPALSQWLMTQRDRGDVIGQLSDGAVADRRFPTMGIPKRAVGLSV
jgi:hypothetical protein